jgi:hypothetical protein
VFAMPVAPQTPPAAQVQLSAPPQPSPSIPQYWTPLAPLQVIGTQAGSTQTPLLLQVRPVGQAPQSTARPHPSPILPQKSVPVVGQFAGMHEAPWTHEPFSQTSVPGQSPQSSTPLQPSPIFPQYWPFGGVHETFTHEPASGSAAGPSGRLVWPPSTPAEWPAVPSPPPPPPAPLLSGGALMPAQPENANSVAPAAAAKRDANSDAKKDAEKDALTEGFRSLTAGIRAGSFLTMRPLPHERS